MATNIANRDDYPDVETAETTEVESVEQTFKHGSLRRVRVTLCWMFGEQFEDGSTGVSNIKEQIVATVEFSIPVGENVAELSGFYPDTNATGERLYRDTLKALRVIGEASSVVDEHTPDDVAVRPPTETINNELTYER